jgi:hypothetical protein
VSLKASLQAWNAHNDSNNQRFTPVGSLFFVLGALCIGIAVGLFSAAGGHHTSGATDQRTAAVCLIALAVLLSGLRFLVERYLRDRNLRRR